MAALVIVKPLNITPAMLIATNVAETDYAAWNTGTYGKGDRVIVLSVHKVYQSLQNANTNHDPTDQVNNSVWWQEVSTTNRWKPFDGSNASQCVQGLSMTFQIRPGVAITSCGVLNITGGLTLTRRMVDPVYGQVYSKTVDISALPPEATLWSFIFGIREAPTLAIANDLPTYPNADLFVEITGTSALAVGVIVIGQARYIGRGVKLGARFGIKDYSTTKANDFGDLVLKKGAYAKRGSFDVSLLKSQIDSTQRLLTSLSATPVLIIGTKGLEIGVALAVITDFETLIPYQMTADCSITYLGMT